MLRGGLGRSREHQSQASPPQGQQPSGAGSASEPSRRSSRTQPGLDPHDGPRSTTAASMFQVWREFSSPTGGKPRRSVTCSVTGEQGVA